MSTYTKTEASYPFACFLERRLFIHNIDRRSQPRHGDGSQRPRKLKAKRNPFPFQQSSPLSLLRTQMHSVNAFLLAFGRAPNWHQAELPVMSFLEGIWCVTRLPGDPSVPTQKAAALPLYPVSSLLLDTAHLPCPFLFDLFDPRGYGFIPHVLTFSPPVSKHHTI